VGSHQQSSLCPATSPRSSAELKQLLGENFEGFSAVIAHTLQSADRRRQAKCLAHLERDLEALKTSRFVGNREFAQRVGEILALARSSHRDYHAGKLNREALALIAPPSNASYMDNPLVGVACRCNDWLTDLSVIGMSGSPS